MSMRDAAGTLARSRAFGRFAELVSRATKPRPGLLIVLTYHRIDEADSGKAAYDGLISASPSVFRAQMRWLVSRYSIVSIDDVVEARRRGRLLPPGAVLLTFDDAYRDFAEHAWPTLRDLGAPATLFVPTAYPGGHRAFWWDRLWVLLARARPLPKDIVVGKEVIRMGELETTFRRLVSAMKALSHSEMLAECDRLALALGEESPGSSPVLTWNELRCLAADGVSLAPHSHTHPRLDRLGPGDVSTEVERSVVELRAAVGQIAPVFAYPDGAHSPAAVEAVKRAGLDMAFTTRRGRNVLGKTPWYLLRRINVGQRANESVIAAQLALWSRLPNR
jgi:peptidoglycan/xylan/chitin deacetylase (PgdA/CDA1 family)